MLRYLQVLKDKPIQILPALGDLTRGAPVGKDYVDGGVFPAGTSETITATYLVDNAPNYDGINAVIAPTDADFEEIKEGDLCLLVTTFEGERYATTEVDQEYLVGTPLKAVGGEFQAAAVGATYAWVYGGPYADPTGLPMHIIERVPVSVTPGEGE